MLKNFNKFIIKAMPILTPAGLLIGVLFGDKITHLSFLIPWIFAYVTLIGNLGSKFKQLDFVNTETFSFSC